MTAITYEAPPTVSRFMDSDAFVRCIMGPVGSGKSSGCVMEFLRRAMEQRPGPDGIRHTRFAAIRNTYPELRDTTRKTFEQWIPSRLGRWHEQSFTFEMRFRDVACDVLFRALDRPEDIKKLLSLELSGAYINEAREVPKSILDVLCTRVGRFPSKKDGGASWFGIWMDTNTWHVGHEYEELFVKTRPEGYELFEQPDGLGPEAENIENLPDGYYPRLCAGRDEEWIDEYIRNKRPRHDKGAIFGEGIEGLERRGGVCEFVHPKDGVHVTFDLGISDLMSMWFWRRNEHGMPDVIDWYENSGKDLEHYFEVMRDRGYAYRMLWLPHDARARSLQTGKSTIEQVVAEFGAERVRITPELSVDDGISAARWMLKQPMRIHSRCGGGTTLKPKGLDRLRKYKFAWDEKKKIYSKVPLHDENSHTGDAFRYVACAVHPSEGTEPTSAQKKRRVVVVPPPPTLDELWAAQKSSRKEPF